MTGKAARTVAQYLVIVESYHPDLLQDSHHHWLASRRKKKKKVAPAATPTPITQGPENEGTLDMGDCEKIAHSGSQELGSAARVSKKAKTRTPKQ